MWTQGLLLAIGLQLMAFLLIYPILAGGVHTAAMKCHGTLRTIQVANGKHYDREMNRKLKLLIDDLSCERFAISFYCFEFFPFKSRATFQVNSMIYPLIYPLIYFPVHCFNSIHRIVIASNVFNETMVQFKSIKSNLFVKNISELEK